MLCRERLLRQGVLGSTKVTGNLGGGKWTFLTSSPGVVFSVCGLAIIIYAIITPSLYEQTLERMGTGSVKSSIQNIDTSSVRKETSKVTSRLLNEKLSALNLLRSKVTMYAVRHKMTGRTTKNITSELNEMPKTANKEPLSTTYIRFISLLKNNPEALLEILDMPDYNWIFKDDCQTQALSTLVEIETANLITQ